MTELSRKFLAISDETPECMTGLLYAALRARALRGGVVILRVARSPGLGGWIGLDKEISQDAIDSARLLATQHADKVEEKTGVTPEVIVLEEEPADAIRKVVDGDPAIKVLVLASGFGRGGPGPLVSRLAKGKPLASRPIVVQVVPGDVSDEQLNEIAGSVA